jgi:UDP-N-acetylmuramoyl-L-alanyl-D-glutamate--2,6-diaminopimelate ligase
MSAPKHDEGVRLRDLFAGVPDQTEINLPDIRVTDITSRSGRVNPGSLFLACRGVAHHGLEFVADAIAADAAAIVWEPAAGVAAPELPDSIINFPVEQLGDHVGDIADRFFGEPSAHMQVTGITGTNGKTTTAWLVSQALNRLGGRTAYMGTLGYGILPELAPSALTTPGCILVHRRLRELLEAGAEAAVMEVSSHGLDQGRVDGVRIATAAFTNLSRDHLDYHGSLEAYKAAKARLFSVPSLGSVVINVGDSFGAQLVGELDGGLRVITVALADRLADGRQAELCATYAESGSEGLRLSFSGAFGEAELTSPLWGRFNAENLLVATGLVVARGYTLHQAITALQSASLPPGRMQLLKGATEAPAVVIDFAHTPDALSNALRTVRLHCRGRVICVFGCGGNRDQGKRSEMGAIAGQLADHLVVTSDNPRDEDPQEIIDAIVAGIENGARYQVIADRAEAIATAIHSAGADDVVLVAGKGSENYQLIAGRAESFSDEVVAGAALRPAS